MSSPGARAPRQVRTGDVLGRYEIGEELGEGGMATVFRARDRELRRDVAVKVLFPHLARRDELVHRFQREARAAAGLEHPNILRIYDVGGGEADDPPYIVMELVRGRTLLDEVAARGALLAEVCACIGAVLADALASAHARGVIHRDIKPANVLIAAGGRLLVGDFGVARVETEDSLVTRTGALLGTPAYMSPEQASGEIATAHSDVYSLGATLYQLATGALPYAGAPAKVLSQISAGGPVAPVRHRLACGPDLSRLIERMMARDPSARPASAAVAASELRAQATAGGLGEPSDELAAYFADAEAYMRAKLPSVVSVVSAAASAAAADGKLPRAMALADRASALAPEDPAVVALVAQVAEGGQRARRNRTLAIAGAVVALGGAVSVVGWQVATTGSRVAPAEPPVAPREPPASRVESSPEPPVASREPPASRVESSPVVRDSPVEPARGSSDDAGKLAAAPTPTSGRSAQRLKELAGTPRQPAVPEARAPSSAPTAGPSERAPTPDSAASTSTAPAQSPAPLEPVRVSHVIIRNDIWCNISIDGVDRGNRRNERLEVAAGRHVIRCVNPVGEWTQEIEVAPGATRTVTGTLLRELEVTLAVDATINGTSYTRGAVVRLKPGNIEVSSGDKKQFITFRANCTLRAVPTLGCYL